MNTPRYQTTSSVTTFIYAMAKYPNVQKKAQEELDRVVGTDRLVSYHDEASLPYIQAVCREIFRWRPVVPLGLFHAAIGEDVYNGYYIPAGKLRQYICSKLTLAKYFGIRYHDHTKCMVCLVYICIFSTEMFV